MADKITKLCFRLLKAEEPEELRPAANELKQAIRERFDAVRENATEIALLDKLVGLRTSTAPGQMTSEAEESGSNQ